MMQCSESVRISHRHVWAAQGEVSLLIIHSEKEVSRTREMRCEASEDKKTPSKTKALWKLIIFWPNLEEKLGDEMLTYMPGKQWQPSTLLIPIYRIPSARELLWIVVRILSLASCLRTAVRPTLYLAPIFWEGGVLALMWAKPCSSQGGSLWEPHLLQ